MSVRESERTRHKCTRPMRRTSTAEPPISVQSRMRLSSAEGNTFRVYTSQKSTSRCLHAIHRARICPAPRAGMAAPPAAEGDTGWVLWTCVKGRGDYVRLCFEEAGVPYEDAGVKHGFEAVAQFCYEGGNKGFPVRAPPVLQHGDFVVFGTNVICSYLNKVFGWGPPDIRSQTHIDQILAVVVDAVAEGRLAFHPVDFYATHKIQVEESKPYVKQYGEERLPKYMKHFEDILKFNGGTPESPGFLIGDSITAADLSVYHCLAAAQQHYGQYYDAIEAPIAKAFQASIAARPRIAAYLASERCQPWDTDSMM